MNGYDAIMLGARCAGAATARPLARESLDVGLVDHVTLPADIACGHVEALTVYEQQEETPNVAA